MATQDPVNTPAATIGANDNNKTRCKRRQQDDSEDNSQPAENDRAAKRTKSTHTNPTVKLSFPIQGGHRCQTVACLLSCIIHRHRQRILVRPAILDAKDTSRGLKTIRNDIFDPEATSRDLEIYNRIVANTSQPSPEQRGGVGEEDDENCVAHFKWCCVCCGLSKSTSPESVAVLSSLARSDDYRWTWCRHS
jgi:hypothetical protein